jgi:hypothetical protein
VGVDVARCLALLGMMATHILPGVVDGRVPLAQQLAGGRASSLFAVLAGTSLVLLTRSRSPLRGREWRASYAGITVRAALVALLGLLLGEVDSGIAVILTYYGVLFLLAGPFLAVTTRRILMVLVVWVVLAPVVSFALRSVLPATTYAVPSFGMLREPGLLTLDLLLTGYYPALTWLPYLLLGIVVGRLDLGSLRAPGLLAGVGAAAVAAGVVVSDALLSRPGVRGELVRTFAGDGWRGDLATTLVHGLYGVVPAAEAPRSWWWLAVRAPHSGTTPDVLVTGGSALVVLALCLLIGRAAPRVCRVAFGAGAMTLTLYSLHVVLRSEGLWDGRETSTFIGQAVLVLVIGAAYALAGHRGPLERLVGVAFSDVRRALLR